MKDQNEKERKKESQKPKGNEGGFCGRTGKSSVVVLVLGCVSPLFKGLGIASVQV